MTSNLKVHVRHLRAAKFCMRGARAWCKAHDWSWSRFVAEGCSADDLMATGDPLALRLVAIAQKESEHGRS